MDDRIVKNQNAQSDSELQAGAAVTRIGSPIDVEQHTTGKPEVADTTSTTHTLTDMAVDYEFFTTAVIHAASIFDRDPIHECNVHNPPRGPEDDILVIDAGFPFFAGLGVVMVVNQPVNMDRRLYAVRRDRWPIVRDFIAGIVMSHQRTGFFARLCFYEMEIVDKFKLDKTTIVTELPMVAVTVFGVSSNKAFAYLQPRRYPGLPTLVREPAKPEMAQHQAEVMARVQK